jgi:hypothetical protein
MYFIFKPETVNDSKVQGWDQQVNIAGCDSLSVCQLVTQLKPKLILTAYANPSPQITGR